MVTGIHVTIEFDRERQPARRRMHAEPVLAQIVADGHFEVLHEHFPDVVGEPLLEDLDDGNELDVFRAEFVAKVAVDAERLRSALDDLPVRRPGRHLVGVGDVHPMGVEESAQRELERLMVHPLIGSLMQQFLRQEEAVRAVKIASCAGRFDEGRERELRRRVHHFATFPGLLTRTDVLNPAAHIFGR